MLADHRLSRRQLVIAALALVMAVVWAVRVAPHDAIASGTSTTTLIDAQTGLCLDSDSSGKPATTSCQGVASQNWVAHGNPQGSAQVATLVNASTGRCLDSNTSGDVYTLPCNGGNYQYWLAKLAPGNGTARPAILVDDATGRCLDSNTSGDLYTLPCNGGMFQSWYLSGAWPWCLEDCTPLPTTTTTTTTPTTPTTPTTTTTAPPPPTTITISVPTPVPTTSTTVAPAPAPPTCALPTSAGTLKLASWIVTARHRGRRARALTVTAGRAVTIAGEVSTIGGRGVAGASVCIGAGAGTRLGELTTVATDTGGRFHYTWRPSASERLGVVCGAPGGAGAVTRLAIALRPRLSLRARPAALRNGQTMTLSGRVMGLHLPSGLVVTLQAEVRSGWETFATASTRHHGAFMARYTFTRTTGRQRYRFRARVAPQLGYRLAVGISHVVSVIVTGP
jgi:hypothetical protein